MITVGNLIRVEIKPGQEEAFGRFLEGALPGIQSAAGTIVWFALRLGPTTFGIFDAFENEQEREAHLQAAWETTQERAIGLLATAPVIERVDILATKLPA